MKVKKRITSALAMLLLFVFIFMTACGGHKAPTSSTNNTGGTESGASTDESGDSSASENTSAIDGTISTDNTPSGNSSTIGNNKTTKNKNQTGTTTTKSPSSKKDTSVRNLGGRVINYACWWEELKKGDSLRANTYWKAKEAIQAKYNVKIKHIFKPMASIDTEIIPSILSGAPIADIFALTQDRMYSQIQKNTLYNLSSLPQFDFSETKWTPPLKAMSTVNDKVYGFNVQDGPYVRYLLLYNKDYFKENNLPDLFELQSKGQLDWNKFREIAKNATKGSVKGFLWPSADEYMSRMLINANGGVLVKRGKGFDFTVTMNSPNTINALKFWQGMRNEDKSCLLTTTGLTPCSEQFAKGSAAMYLGPRYLFPSIAKQAKFKVGMVLFPAGPDASLPYLLEESEQVPYVMAVNAKKPQDIAMVWDQFAGADIMPWKDEYYDMFCNKDIITTMQKYVDLVRAGKYNMDYCISIGDLYQTGISSGLQAVSKGEQTPVQAIESVQGKLRAAITAFNK